MRTSSPRWLDRKASTNPFNAPVRKAVPPLRLSRAAKTIQKTCSPEMAWDRIGDRRGMGENSLPAYPNGTLATAPAAPKRTVTEISLELKCKVGMV